MREKKWIVQDKSLVATIVISVVIVAIFGFSYFRIGALIEKRCLTRMEEGVNTATEEIVSKLNRDSRILNAAAQLLASADSFDTETIKEMIRTFTPLLETKRMQVMLPNELVIDSNGEEWDAGGKISFEAEAALGEHITDRKTSIQDGNTLVLRHFVPIVKDGETAALLYGVTILDNLPSALNIDNIYGASASVYIIDAASGDFIMDTWHTELGNLADYEVKDTKSGASWETVRREIQDGKKGYTVFRTPRTDGWTYFYYAPAGVNQWAIAVSVPERQAFANLYEIQRVFLAAALVMAAVILAYYLWVRQNAKSAMEKAVEQAVLTEKLHKAEAAERAKTMFLSNMSHDIRTPMNAIIGFTTLAETNIDNKERVQEYHAKILSSSNHLLSLINDILDMSRIESGRLNIEEKECSISDIFRDMRNIIQTQMETKQLNFFMDTIDVTDEDIFCDKLHVNQVLLNLLSNAIKFTPAGGSVSLAIRQKPCARKGYGAYEIRVKDTGIGMSPEFAEHVFEPFEREKTSTVSGIQGTGLGMAITKSIVDTMGGTIEVQTEQGRGTEFIINFEFRLQKEQKKVEVIEELRGMRALVVDDSFSTCDSVTKMLLQIGMRAEWTMHGKEAVLRAKQALEMEDGFYAYIIDWVLPDLSGIEVARQIRQTVGEGVPIIILSAYDWSAIEEEARHAGVTAFCSKPIFVSDLRDILISVIGRKEISERETLLPETEQGLKGKRLLLVEDNELNREIAEEILKESGFLVETAADGTYAVDMVRRSAPGYYALVLMDVQMPVMNGYEATRAIRALDDPELARIPVVAMTANAFEEDRREALESGMDAHVAKPINVQKLMEVIGDLLREKET